MATGPRTAPHPRWLGQHQLWPGDRRVSPGHLVWAAWGPHDAGAWGASESTLLHSPGRVAALPAPSRRDPAFPQLLEPGGSLGTWGGGSRWWGAGALGRAPFCQQPQWPQKLLGAGKPGPVCSHSAHQTTLSGRGEAPGTQLCLLQRDLCGARGTAKLGPKQRRQLLFTGHLRLFLRCLYPPARSGEGTQNGDRHCGE